MFSNKNAECSKHQKSLIILVCSMQGCNFGNLICESCIKTEPQHTSMHKNYIFNLNDSNHQNTKISAKLLPSLSQTVIDLEKKITFYSQHIETEIQEIDRDFSILFKIFFNASETTKNFLKDSIRNDLKKINEKLTQLKKNLKDVGDQESPKKPDSFFNNIFAKDPDKIEASSTTELIIKLITKNQTMNKLRADILTFNGEVEATTNNPIRYKKNEKSTKLYEEIKENFDKSCKEMYRQFKLLFEGGDSSDMRKSIFTMKKSLAPQTINIDLDSTSSKDKEQSEEKKTLLKVFPDEMNPHIGKVKKAFGLIDFKQEDSFFNNVPEQGPFQYEDGSIYQGQFKDNMKHGRGKFLFKDAAYYEGYWKEDIPYGFGRFIKPNGDFYEGMCVNLKAQGKGSFFSTDGYVYNGDWDNDKKHGIGHEVIPNGIEIKGTYENGLLNGTASLKFPDGSMYVGEVKNQKVTGRGEYTYANGEKYYGQLVNGKKEGNGVYIWPDGRRYDGQFSGDLNHGNGMFFWPDGFIYNGQWKNGLQHGFGIEKNEKEGWQKEGEWDNGKWIRWTKQAKI